MAAMTAGFAQIVVKPTFTGFNRAITRELNTVMPRAGRDAGESLGAGMATGFSSATSALQREMRTLSTNLARSQDELNRSQREARAASDDETKALRDLRTAQSNLDSLRANSRTTTAQLRAAEDDLADRQRLAATASDRAGTARTNLDRDTDRLRQSEQELQTATDRANRETAQTDDVAESARRGMRRLRDGTDDTREGFGRLGGYLKGGFATIIAAVSFGAIKDGMTEIISLAGDFQQSTGAIGAVFKDKAGEVSAKASTSASDVGIDKNAYNELSSLLGAQLKNANVPMEELAGSTDKLIGLGADLSSMFGGDAKTAIESISSALKGEMDPIEKYGITLNQAALEAEAVSKGLVKPVKDAAAVSDASTKMTLAQKKYNEVVKEHGKDSDEAARAKLTLTAAERAFSKATAGKLPKIQGQNKAMAVMSALFTQSADSQGNFAKESDTLQGQQQRMNAEFANLKIEIGTEFLPVMTTMTMFVRDNVIPAVKGAWEGLKTMGEWVQKNSVWIGPLATGLAAGAAALGLWTLATKAATGWTKAAAGAQALFNRVLAMNPILKIVMVISALVGAFMYLWNTNEDFRNFFIGMWNNITSFFRTVWEQYLQPVFAAIGAWITDVLVPAFVSFYNDVIVPVWTNVSNFIRDAWNNVIMPALKAIGDFITLTLVPIFVWLYQFIIKPIFDAIKLVITIAATIIVLAVKAIVWYWQNVLGPMISWVWTTIIQPVFKALGEFFGWVWNSVLKPVIDALVWYWQNILGPAIAWAWENVIKPIFSNLGKFFSWVWNSVLKPAIDALVWYWNKVLSPAIKWAWNNVIKPVFKALGEFFKWVWNSVLKPAIDALVWYWNNVLAPVIKWAWNNILKPVFKALGDFFRWVWENVLQPAFKAVGDAFKAISDTVKYVWEKFIQPVFRALGDFITKTVAPAFQKGVDAIKKVWETVANIARVPINFVIETVYNNGLKSTFNGIAEKLGLGWRLPDADSLPAFAKGGLARKGWALVGEEGPELVNFTNPGRVYTAAETQSMLDGKTQAPTAALPMLNGGHDEKTSMLPIGGFWSDIWKGVTDTVGAAKDWVVGKIADGVRALVQPVKDGITNVLPGSGVNELIRGSAFKVIDDMTNWAVKKDDKKEAEQQAAAAASGVSSYDGPLGTFTRPSKGPFTSLFGVNRGSYSHMGLDIAGGGPTYSAWDGVVQKVGSSIVAGRTGIGILIDHGNGMQTYYGHNPVGGPVVKPGDKVSSGQHIGAQGATGNVTGVHLHFETWKNGTPVNPMSYINGGPVAGHGKATKYDNGGWLTPGTGLVTNQTRSPEPIFTGGQWSMISTLVDRGAHASRSSGVVNNIYANAAISGQEVSDSLAFAARRNNRRS